MAGVGRMAHLATHGCYCLGKMEMENGSAGGGDEGERGGSVAQAG